MRGRPRNRYFGVVVGFATCEKSDRTQGVFNSKEQTSAVLHGEQSSSIVGEGCLWSFSLIGQRQHLKKIAGKRINQA